MSDASPMRSEASVGFVKYPNLSRGNRRKKLELFRNTIESINDTNDITMRTIIEKNSIRRDKLQKIKSQFFYRCYRYIVRIVDAFS
jgi:hypothetical protein